MSFLTAEWRRLAIVNYAIDPDALKPFVPAGTELDPWNGTHYASLIGFRFVNTRVLGLPIPFHTSFEEVNLRFYVRHRHGREWRRGVVFVKEIVPRPAITLVANALYHEHYETRKMRHRWARDGNSLLTQYEWRHGDSWQSLRIESTPTTTPIAAGSEEEFITEHYWGYTRVDERTTYEYEVTHPVWEVYPVKGHVVDVDFGAVYGDRFAHLSTAIASSVMLAEGSPITVEGKRTI